MGLRYFIANSALQTTAAPVKQPTGTAIRTMMQLKLGSNGIIPVAWGLSLDASAAGVPGQCELFETTVAATMSTAYANADIQPWDAVNLANASNIPIDTTSTSTSGFATAAVTEGTVANARTVDLQLIAPTNQYSYTWPLGREFQCIKGNFLRVRVTFGASVNAYIWVLLEV
jgi:hypothetical protein